jgi:hypothetical protein
MMTASNSFCGRVGVVHHMGKGVAGDDLDWKRSFDAAGSASVVGVAVLYSMRGSRRRDKQ